MKTQLRRKTLDITQDFLTTTKSGRLEPDWRSTSLHRMESVGNHA